MPDALQPLRVADILVLCRTHGFPICRSLRTRYSIVQHVMINAPSALQQILMTAATNRAAHLNGTANSANVSALPDRFAAPWTYDCTHFVDLPSAADVRKCYQQFYNATGNSALKSSICSVCAGEYHAYEETVHHLPLDHLPNRERLVPPLAHPEHHLTEGLLLERAAVSIREGVTYVAVCHPCYSQLLKDMQGPPRHALANNLWIGPIPGVLESLTFPEQLLMSLVFPRIYVFKLFPKSFARNGDIDTLQRGMKGTLSSFAMDTAGVAAMVSGNMLPHPPSILASLISVTIVSHTAIPSSWLKSTFRVRRGALRLALLWTKAHNPKYFGDIVVDERSVMNLPEDDIPDEILNVVRHNAHEDALDYDAAGYVPEDYTTDAVEIDTDDPYVIPLQISGTIDVDLTATSAEELRLWALEKLWTEGAEGGYIARHSRQPINDFPNDVTGNYFERAFPVLFPWGVGGIEAPRPTPISLKDHVKWCLRYYDRRFRTHYSFPFAVFAIQQKRQALGSARIQMRRQHFERDALIFNTITPESLRQASLEEANGNVCSDNAINLLRKHVTAAAGRVQGSDQTRMRFRSQIWSTCIIAGPPNLWITINPSDLHDPIAQIFAGEDIDMDAFIATAGPTKEKRALNIANDPYAAAKFFHFLVNTVLEQLFQVKVGGNKVTSGVGVLGRVSAYFGSVEAQGRGTLHLHMLIWLANSPKPTDMIELLQSDWFREKVVLYLKETLRAYLPGLESRQAVMHIPSQKEIAYNRSPNPASPTFQQDMVAMELALARSEQVHTCQAGRCLLTNRQGEYVCKRGAPFACNDVHAINERGQWVVERRYGMVNTWSPAILLCCRCNNDAKFLTNAVETRGITFYVSSYTAKKQNRNHNLSAIMADAYAYHRQHKRLEYVNNIREQNRLLLFRMMNNINREQELSAPMVLSYLMDWGDVYQSHTYSPIYWSSFAREVRSTFPGIYRQETQSEVDLSIPLQQPEGTQGNDKMDNVIVPLRFDEGRLAVKSQITDYRLRGNLLENMSVMDFFVKTYEAPIRPSDREDALPTGRGRPRHLRARYLNGHAMQATMLRIVRDSDNRNLPNLIGGWLPSNDDANQREWYISCMLTFLKPWRNLRSDLKDENASWENTWTTFVENAENRTKYIIDCIQFYHDCISSARNEEPQTRLDGHEDDADTCELAYVQNDDESHDAVYTEDGLDAFIRSQVPYREQVHGRIAVEIGHHAHIFSNNNISWTIPSANMLTNAYPADIEALSRWRKQMACDVEGDHRQANTVEDVTDAEVTLLEQTGHDTASIIHNAPAEEALSTLAYAQLNEDQRRAFNIVLWHLQRKLSGEDPPPLLMVLSGEGGTGKSKVIQSITDAFHSQGVEQLLLKSAYTGVAASLIEGKTTHSIASLNLSARNALSGETVAKLQNLWREKEYLVIDEYSMIAKSFLALLSKHVAVGKTTINGSPSPHPFGGVSVILCGDLHQFPPVGKAKRDALFYPINGTSDTFEMQIGRGIYEQFRTVVILRKQMRVVDEEWAGFLRHLRHGNISAQDLTILQELLIGQRNQKDDFSRSPWNNCALVTPRHGVRKMWNEAMCRKHCIGAREQLLECHAEDRINGRPLTLAEKYAVAGRIKSQGSRQRKDLDDCVHLAKGLQVMVTNNIELDLDVTNGARGEIVDILLHPEEPPLGDKGEARLKHLPIMLLVKLQRTRASRLEGLELGVIPVEPCTSTMIIKVANNNGKMISRTVKRRQFPITPAYAFTDYRAQGQTLPFVIVDIARPPSGGLTLFNLYVALSRSKGRNSLRLLRPFDADMFMEKHDPALLEEDERLEKLDEETTNWWRRISCPDQNR